MDLLRDVFFWATIATATIVLEIVIFIARRKHRRAVYLVAGICALIFFEVPRILIPLLPQPTIGLSATIARTIGGVIFVLGTAILAISFTQLMKAKKEGWRLRTTGVYAIVRHPMYTGDVLWALGWSVIFNALWGLILTPLWFFLRYSLAVLEEEKLVEKYGEDYKAYMKNVPRRMISFLGHRRALL